ncbi:hypothetical protein [Jiella pacifica]|uniref:Uncharacterized protein n=1 Tax=Jiella pacifica TaxID=2696469 RepID=A0A6N9T5F1_9HYPH|nr:hypothetical protein [Jiella pacifica]NDW06614.1 hypothetical protein [Jiella pacifica]
MKNYGLGDRKLQMSNEQDEGAGLLTGAGPASQSNAQAEAAALRRKPSFPIESDAHSKAVRIASKIQ